MDNFIFNPTEKTQDSMSFEYYGVSGTEDYLDADGMPRMAQDSPKVYEAILKAINATAIDFNKKTEIKKAA